MPINWPPPTSPTWPPPEMNNTWFSCSDWEVLLEALKEFGFTHDAPTGQERNAFFRDAQCDDLHPVIGRMIISPISGIRYPFCVCNNAQHRELLVLWPPFTCGSLAGPVGF